MSEALPLAAAPSPAGRGSINDLWAGLAAAAVVLPQAMAFGVALFQAMGLDAAAGASAGLVGAAVLCMVSGLAGATAGVISSPTGPSLALLSGAMATMLAAGVEAPAVLPALVAVTVVAGCAQIVLGVFGGARLIRYIPHPVVAGFMIGSAILMLRSQIGPVIGRGADDAWQMWRWLPAATAATTLLVQQLSPRQWPRVPGTIVGLAAGALLFGVGSRFGPGPVPDAWLIGELPSLALGGFGFERAAFLGLPWRLVVTSGLALGVMASLNILLTSTIADARTGLRHDARRELVAQGIGQALLGALGGMGGSSTTGATMLAVRTGGRRWAGVMTALVLAATLLFLGSLAALIPISALAGIIVAVSLGLIDLDILAWARRRRTRQDAGIALIVAIATVQFGLIAAIGIGVVIAVVLFVNAQVREPVVHRRADATQQRSLRRRSDAQRDVLNQQGRRIVLYELRGDLFFARADQLFDELLVDLDRPAWVILDLYRVARVDLTGMKILEQAARRLAGHGGELVFCEVYRSQGLGRQVDKTLHKLSPKRADTPAIRTFVGVDEALEYAEDRLLDASGVPPTHPLQHIELAENDLFRDMAGAYVDAIRGVMRLHRVPAGVTLFERGDPGTDLYFVVSGEVEIRLPLSKHHYRRLAIYGPGTCFGEVAFLDPGPRTGGAHVTLDCELYALDRAALEQLRRDAPEAAIGLLLSLGRMQCRTQRWSVSEIRSLSQR